VTDIPGKDESKETKEHKDPQGSQNQFRLRTALVARITHEIRFSALGDQLTTLRDSSRRGSRQGKRLAEESCLRRKNPKIPATLTNARISKTQAPGIVIAIFASPR
jgi:hypothetical protein